MRWPPWQRCGVGLTAMPGQHAAGEQGSSRRATRLAVERVVRQRCCSLQRNVKGVRTSGPLHYHSYLCCNVTHITLMDGGGPEAPRALTQAQPPTDHCHQTLPAPSLTHPRPCNFTHSLTQQCCVCGPPSARQQPCDARRQAKAESRPRHWTSSMHLIRPCSQETLSLAPVFASGTHATRLAPTEGVATCPGPFSTSSCAKRPANAALHVQSTSNYAEAHRQ